MTDPGFSVSIILMRLAHFHHRAARTVAAALLGLVGAAATASAQLPTFTPFETFTPIRSFTPIETFTPFRTFTPVETFTPFPSPTALGFRTPTTTRTATATPGGPTPTATQSAQPTVSPTRTMPGSPTRSHTPFPTLTPFVCVGDCTGDGILTINELIVGVLIALDQATLTSCEAMDVNGDSRVTIDELIRAVDLAGAGCL